MKKGLMAGKFKIRNNLQTLKTYHIMEELAKQSIIVQSGANKSNSVSNTFKIIENLSNDEGLKEKQKQVFRSLVSDDIKKVKQMLS